MDEALGILRSLDIEPNRGMLRECVDRVNDHILVYCNIDEVPERLRHLAAKASVAEYLAGISDASEIQRGHAVSGVQQGDTSVQYGDTGAMISQYIERNRLDGRLLNAYRKLRW